MSRSYLTRRKEKESHDARSIKEFYEIMKRMFEN